MSSLSESSAAGDLAHRSFWRRWLRVWCWAVGLFGVVLIGGAFEATNGPVRMVVELMHGPQAFDAGPQARFSLALMGAVSLGWALTLAAAFEAAAQLGAQGGRIWRRITFAAVAWFAIDSTLSIATGYGLNAVPNLVFFAAYLLPVMRMGVLRG
jgi:hypothetical protein